MRRREDRRRTAASPLAPASLIGHAAAARLMGVDPWKVQYLRMAADVGGTVSEGRIEVTGT